MAGCRMDKVVVVTLLEAVKIAIERIGSYRMELADRGVEDTRRVVATYGDVRRLKDYLQRCVGAYREEVDLDLAAEDLPLLAACCRHGAEHMDLRLGTCTNSRDRDLLQQKRGLLADCAVEFATDPLLELPLPRQGASLTPAMRSLRMRLARKLDQLAMQRPAREPDTSRPEAEPASEPALPDPGLGGRAAGSSPSVGPRQWPASSALTVNGPASTLAAAPSTATSPGIDADEGALVGVSPEAGPVASMSLGLDVRRICHPQLRALMALDLRALDRAIAARDLRLATVHLTSGLEGAVIDHAIPRALQLGLAGRPDSWNPVEILLALFGGECSPQDRASALHVFAAPSLIRPARQLKESTVVTVVGFRGHFDFIRRALRIMGYT